MAHGKIIGSVLLLGTMLSSGTGSGFAEGQKAEGNKGLTVEDLGRGLKSAAQNVEKEIPKIGPAIGETFKKLTDKTADKKPAQEPAKDKQ